MYMCMYIRYMYTCVLHICNTCTSCIIIIYYSAPAAHCQSCCVPWPHPLSARRSSRGSTARRCPSAPDTARGGPAQHSVHSGWPRCSPQGSEGQAPEHDKQTNTRTYMYMLWVNISSATHSQAVWIWEG